MCRIVGIRQQDQPIEAPLLDRMRDTMAYGGPDAAQSWISEDGRLGFGHRRLSILDLSEEGTQPFHWNGMTICFNGEVYNFTEVKKKMPEYEFKSGTDTEVILKAFHKWGKECVHHFRGMFAFAIYAPESGQLVLCRDRVGVKPLYWYLKDGLFMFASELKAFHQHPAFDTSINHEAVSLFLQQGYIPSPQCIFKHAHKLEAGHWMEVDASLNIKKTKYWSVKQAYAKSETDQRSEDLILEELEALLKESFQLRMVADVPVGMFLSGGIDSSLVTALLQNQYDHPLKTFTIGFEHKERDEAPYAKKVAEHLGTDHTELYCTESDATDIIPEFFSIYDEPTGDHSGIPTYLVSKLAREQVKVSLSADGADELFGGYAKYQITKNYYGKVNALPRIFRKGMSKMIGTINPDWLENNRHYFPVLRNYNDLNTKFSKLQNSLSANDMHDFFNVASSFMSPSAVETFVPSPCKTPSAPDR
ncbi:MAG: asparagine synthase (glutamine-hydrolyzing) [Bacteroidota bacterium]